MDNGSLCFIVWCMVTVWNKHCLMVILWITKWKEVNNKTEAIDILRKKKNE